jgi:hypothetical protein
MRPSDSPDRRCRPANDLIRQTTDPGADVLVDVLDPLATDARVRLEALT